MQRVKIFEILVILASLLIVARLIYWQFFSQLEGRSDLLSQDIKVPARRGEIFARDGFPLVTNQQAFLVYAKPYDIDKDPKQAAEALTPLLIPEKYATEEAKPKEDEMDKKRQEQETKKAELEKKLQKQRLFWVLIARKVQLQVRDKIASLNIKGIGWEQDEKRFYPEASMAASALGFVAQDKFGEDAGYFGLEGFYNSALKGRSGRLGQEKDPFGFPILVGKYLPIGAKPGSSLYTTIDRSVQYIVERKLEEAVKKYGARDGTIIVAEPQSGKIIAIATYPSYDPAFYSEFDEKYYKNLSVADTYEPGSTFKLITMSAALDSSVLEPTTHCDICSGPRQIGGFEISTWNKKYYPNSNMIDVIIHSDNVGMTFVGDKLGVDHFYDYIKKFGFGEKTGIDLQEEVPGAVRSKDEWRPIDLATASFGQGIAVTPIQMIQAVGAIANKGELNAPRIVEKITDGDNQKKVLSEKRQVISAKTAALITEMMVKAVENGEAKAFVPKGYSIAGKTGTAQIPVSGHYDPNKTIASFVGFAPAHDPKFVMLVRFSEPSSSPFGSETAAPTFFAIAKELFVYFGILPEK